MLNSTNQSKLKMSNIPGMIQKYDSGTFLGIKA